MEDKKIFEDKVTRCSFCGRTKKEDKEKLLFAKGRKEHESPWICMMCVSKYHKAFANMLLQQKHKAQTQPNNFQKFLPKNIKSYLDNYIIGQEKAKRVLSVAIYNHMKALKLNSRKIDYEKNPFDEKVEIEKSNILLIGPTGSGKTAMIKRIARYLNRPFAIGDATTYTAAGYVGADVESVLKTLYINSGCNVAAAEQGIVYIDEIDKTSRKRGTASKAVDPSHEGVQQALLKLVEGSKVEVTVKGQGFSRMGETITIDTSNILFIFGGSFEGIEEIIKRRKDKGKTRIGFGAKVENREKAAEFNDYILDVTTEDLREFGMLPELLGRMPVIAPMRQLDRKALIEILITPKNSLIRQYQELMKLDNIHLQFTDEALFAIVDEAIKRKTGARSLRSILEDVLNSVMFSFANNEVEVNLIVDYRDNLFAYDIEPVEEYSSSTN